LIVATLESTPEHATHWSRKKMLLKGFRAGTVRVVPPRHDPQLPAVGHEIGVPQPQRLPDPHRFSRVIQPVA